MGEHYTKNTVSASVWCTKCYRITEHNVYLGTLGPCTICLKKLDDAAAARKLEPATAKQANLFD